MNNLKFRAWDKKKNTFTNYQIVDGMLYFMDKFTGVWIRDDNQDRFALMQSTGLFDKYGVEIYEGDILTDEGNFENDYWDYATIEFDKTDYTYYIHWKREEVCENITDCYKYTVTSNIYENKELLR